jgi:transcriptional accessory protein Tex/SPT6
MLNCPVCGQIIDENHIHSNNIPWYAEHKLKFEQIAWTSILEYECELTLEEIDKIRNDLTTKFNDIRRSFDTFAYRDHIIQLMWSVYQYKHIGEFL